jgi:hypothetical protein
MAEQFQWSILALAQPADVQVALFPDFVLVADELAIAFEEGLAEVADDETNTFQKEKIEALDRLIMRISGEENLKYWIDDALQVFPEWDEIRAAAAEVASAFGWPVQPPPPAPGIYIGMSQ